MESILTKSQSKTFGPRFIAGWGKDAQIRAFVRYDDQCGNGHNTFAITGEIRRPRRNDCEACGMLHEEIARVFPQLQPFLKWHLMSSDEPIHYVANTLFWLGYDTQWCKGKPDDPPNFEHAKSTAVWPEMPSELMEASSKYTREQVAKLLQDRLSTLQADFKQAVEELGFTY